MPGKIDRAALFVLLLALGFVLFWAAVGRWPVALALTCALGLSTHACCRAWRARCGANRAYNRARARDARALIDGWAVRPDADAAEAHVRARFASSPPFAFRLLARHGAAPPLNANDLLSLWREHAGDERLVAASTGPIDREAQALAATLSSPAVRLLDADALADALAGSGLELPEAPPARRRLRLPRLAPSRKKAPYCLIYALFMLAAYWLLGAPVYLLAALFLIALAVLGLKKPGATPTELFPG